jgi:hypothetical protein
MIPTLRVSRLPGGYTRSSTTAIGFRCPRPNGPATAYRAQAATALDDTRSRGRLRTCALRPQLPLRPRSGPLPPAAGARQLLRPPEPHTARLGALSALAGARADKRALELGEATQDGEHELPVRRRGIRPGVLERAEAGTRPLDGFEHVQQIARRPGQAVKAWQALSIAAQPRMFSRGDAPANEANVYETVKCLACTRTHLINKSTGRVLGR